MTLWFVASGICGVPAKKVPVNKLSSSSQRRSCIIPLELGLTFCQVRCLLLPKKPPPNPSGLKQQQLIISPDSVGWLSFGPAAPLLLSCGFHQVAAFSWVLCWGQDIEDGFRILPGDHAFPQHSQISSGVACFQGRGCRSYLSSQVLRSPPWILLVRGS